jgi:ArsR family transcriptional regulator
MFVDLLIYDLAGLVETTGLTQANVSRHLQTLTGAGILRRRKEGPNVIYYVADESIFELCDHVCSSLQKRLAEQARTFALDR